MFPPVPSLCILQQWRPLQAAGLDLQDNDDASRKTRKYPVLSDFKLFSMYWIHHIHSHEAALF
jgi:hypothetical protein